MTKRGPLLSFTHSTVYPNAHRTAIIGGPPQHRDYLPRDHVFFPEVHDTVRVGPYTTIDCGQYDATRVGAHTLILGHCNIGHDAQVGEHVEIADSVVVAGHAVIEDYARIGIGAMILPYKRVGTGARVGAGAIVTRDVPPNTCVAGNPARELYKFCVVQGCWEKQDPAYDQVCSYRCLVTERS